MSRVSRKDMGTVEDPFVGGDERARGRCRTRRVVRQERRGKPNLDSSLRAVSLDISLSDHRSQSPHEV